MKDWYELVNDLETTVPPLDEVTQKRILHRVVRPRKRRLTLVALIAAVMMLTACGVAVVTGQFSHWFRNISEDIGAPEASQTLFEELGTVIGQSQTAGSITMTLDGALWDGEYLFLSLSVDGLEGDGAFMDKFTSLDSWLTGSKAFMYGQVREAYPHMTDEEIEAYWGALASLRRPGITYIPDRETGEHRLLVQQALGGERETELTLHLENMELGKETIAGPFEFTFTVSPKPMTQVYTGDVVFECGSLPAIRITEVRMDPFKAELDFTTVDETVKIDLKDIKAGTLMARGEETDGGNNSGLRTVTDMAGHTDHTLSCGPFRQIVDPRTVTAVKINDTWLELSQFTLQE